MNCGRNKAMKLLAELDNGKGVGLIERKKQGQGKPTRIYVKRFTTQELLPQPDPSIYPPAPSGRQMGMDRYELREEVKENIEYEHLRQELPYGGLFRDY